MLDQINDYLKNVDSFSGATAEEIENFRINTWDEKALLKT